MKLPGDLLTDANRAREAADLNSVSDLADNKDVEQAADRFSSEVEFNVQPTDDGEKVFAQVDSGTNLLGFVQEVLASALSRAGVEDAQRAQAQAEQQAAAEQNATLTEQRGATLASTRTDNQLATQTIAAAWRAILGDTRSRLPPQQRAWIRKKSADCAVEAASASIEPSEREAARLGCDTRLTQERLGVLNGYRAEAPDEVFGGGTEPPDNVM